MPNPRRQWWCIQAPDGELYLSSGGRLREYAWINFAGHASRVEQVRKDFDDYRAVRIRVTVLDKR